MAYRGPRHEAGVAMLGTTGSGKSTFLGALDIALLEQEGDWRIWSSDPASKKALIEMSDALNSKGEFPLPTGAIDTFEWTLSGQVERTVRNGRRGTRTVQEPVSLTLKLTDPTGELGRPDQIGQPTREQLMENLASSRGILYMFDPIREFRKGDAFAQTNNLVKDLMATMGGDPAFDGRLPHHLAVCVTKLDDPRVFKTAESLGILMEDDRRFPRVHNHDARFLLDSLCKVSKRGNGDAVPRLLGRCFHPDRISYYVTSAVGFMVNKRTRGFDDQDTENVYQIASGRSLVRGPVHPINVVEPVLWLVDRLLAAGE